MPRQIADGQESPEQAEAVVVAASVDLVVVETSSLQATATPQAYRTTTA